MISKKTAHAIWTAHNEIEKAHKLIDDLKKSIENIGRLELKDTWGNYEGLRLAVPSGVASASLYNIPPEIALSVIDAHIKKNEKDLVELRAIAEIELR